jgi:hypothetical protein
VRGRSPDSPSHRLTPLAIALSSLSSPYMHKVLLNLAFHVCSCYQELIQHTQDLRLWRSGQKFKVIPGTCMYSYEVSFALISDRSTGFTLPFDPPRATFLRFNLNRMIKSKQTYTCSVGGCTLCREDEWHTFRHQGQESEIGKYAFSVFHIILSPSLFLIHFDFTCSIEMTDEADLCARWTTLLHPC